MNRLITALVSVLIFTTPAAAWAQDDRAERLALSERAIDAMQGEQMADMVQQMTQAFPPSSLERLPPNVRGAFDEVMPEITDAMMARLLDGTADIYAEIYTREELEALVAFYESPVGQSITTKAYAATPQIIELTRSLLPQMIRDMVNGVCDRLECSAEERRDFMTGAMSSLDMRES